jgi:peptide/nickel transport system substrate-binding protein
VFVALLAMGSVAQAAPFKCPYLGGSSTFDQEANINSLDQMTSSRTRRWWHYGTI